jgi:hypothetical protein
MRLYYRFIFSQKVIPPKRRKQAANQLLFMNREAAFSLLMPIMKHAAVLLFTLVSGLLMLVHLAAAQQDASPSIGENKLVATSVPDLKPDAQGAISQEQMQQLFRVVAANDLENDKRLRNYTYVERDDEHKLDGDGQIKSSDVKSYEVLELYGEQVRRLTEKDDKPLDSKDAAKEEEKLQKIIDKRKEETDDARQKREDKEEKDREHDRQFVREVADAYNFHLVGTEVLEGRDAWVIDAEPRPGYEPHMKDAKFLPKFRFRAWIDKGEAQWAKLDVECIETVSIGLFLARIHKGSRIVIEQKRVNDEVWLPLHVSLKIDARVALLKEDRVEQDVTFRDYKKFRASTRIVNLGETKP